MLRSNNLWMTGIIRQRDREKPAVTDDSLLHNIVPNTEQIHHALLNSETGTIYFTSRFGVNNAGSLFTQAFEINHGESFDTATSAFTIPEKFFEPGFHKPIGSPPSASRAVKFSDFV